MKTFKYTIKDPNGLHARPAGLLVKCAQSCSTNVNISKDNKAVTAKQLFAVMGLNIKQNDTVTFQIEGNNEAADCANLKIFCEKNI